MNCERARELWMDSLVGQLDEDDRRFLEGHLAACESCRQQADCMESLWQDLGELEISRSAVPSDRLIRRFRLALADYEAELQNEQPRRLREWWASLWTVHPAWQAAFSAALLLVGVLVGAGITANRATRSEVEALRAEMASMSRSMTLSLLHHQSASERLRAVSWGRMAGSDEEVLAALLDAVGEDPNVNVRLAAIDALAAYSDRPPIRAGLLDVLQREDSPLVQLAVLEVVAGEDGLHNGDLEKLIDSGEVDETVLRYLADQAESL